MKLIRSRSISLNNILFWKHGYITYNLNTQLQDLKTWLYYIQFKYTITGLETWLYYIQFKYTITGFGNKLIPYINSAPQDNCLQRTYSIKSCTIVYNNKKIQCKFFVFL